MHQPMQGAMAQAPKPAAPDKGWGYPARANKAHYFVNGRALCRRWLFFGELSDDWHNHPQNCAACMRARDKLSAALHPAPSAASVASDSLRASLIQE